MWALGATLFAAVEGSPPFPEHSNALAMLSTIATSEPPEPERAGPLSEAIRNMMQLDPTLRWSMADVAYNLHRVHEQQQATGTQEHVRPMPAPPDPAVEPPGGGDSTTLIEPVSDTQPEPEPGLPSELTPAPVPDADPRRRRWPLLLVAAAAVLAAAMVWALFGHDGSGDPDDSSGRSQQNSNSDQDAKTESPPADQDAPTPEEAAPEPSDGSPEQFVSDYYALLPGDTQAAWKLLSSDMQAEVGSYGDYEGFWSTIDSVTVDDTTSVDAGTVEVTLTYTTDGTSEQEVRQIDLTRQGDGFVIVGD